jgi:hypothetical protein
MEKYFMEIEAIWRNIKDVIIPETSFRVCIMTQFSEVQQIILFADKIMIMQTKVCI